MSAGLLALFLFILLALGFADKNWLNTPDKIGSRSPGANTAPSAPSENEKGHHKGKKIKKAKKKVRKEKAKRKKAESKCEKLKHELEMEKKLDAERQRSHELTCELKFHRQLIHLLYPDLDRKLGECSGGENQNES